MEKIYYKNILVAIRISKIKKGSLPLTEAQEPLQLVTLKHPKGTYLRAHVHVPKERKTEKLQECLIVRYGKVRIDLYTSDKEFFKYIYLTSGQILILVNGGYGIHLVEKSELIEVKNGPFVEDKVLI